jgi:hypothetical protein
MNAVIRSGLALLLAANLGMIAAAQNSKSDKDLLEEAKRQQDIATQKAEAELRETLNKVRSAGSAEALAILKEALANVEANTSIRERNRAAMAQMLKDRIRIAELAPKTGGDKSNVPATTIKDDRRKAKLTDLQKQDEERKQVQAAVKAIDRLVGQQRTQEAERKAAELASQFPNNTAARAMGKKSFIVARIREANDLLREQESRITMAMNDVTRSSIPANGNVEFDKDHWRKITRLRKDDQLTKKEKEILQALSKTVQPDWKNSQFQDVITYLSTLTGQTILIDKKALEDASIGTESAVNFVAPREVSVRTALRKILGDLGLAYVVRDETIYVTTSQKARDLMTTRVYPLGDLVTPNGLIVPPDIAALQEAEVVKGIIGMIKKSIDPMSWDTEGGKASIHYNAVTKALVVRQSAEIHMLLRNSLGR